MVISHHVGHVVDPRALPINGVAVFSDEVVFICFYQASIQLILQSLLWRAPPTTAGEPTEKESTWRRVILLQLDQTMISDTITDQRHQLKPFLGIHKDGGNGIIWIQNLIDLSLCLLVDAILLLCVAEAADHVVHCREIIMTFPLGAQTNLVTMMFNLWLVPQRCLDLKFRTIQTFLINLIGILCEKTKQMSTKWKMILGFQHSL